MVLVMLLLLMLSKKALIKVFCYPITDLRRESSSPISNDKVFSVSSAKEEGGYQEQQTQTEIICGTIGTDQE